MEKHCNNPYNNIENKAAYFHIVVKNMDKKDKAIQSKIDKHEIQIEDVLYSNLFCSFDIDEQISQQSLLSWVDMIENETLYKAVNKLSSKDKMFISYIFKERRTQRELADIYHITHQNISKRLNSILKRLKQSMNL